MRKSFHLVILLTAAFLNGAYLGSDSFGNPFRTRWLGLGGGPEPAELRLLDSGQAMPLATRGSLTGYGGSAVGISIVIPLTQPRYPRPVEPSVSIWGPGSFHFQP